MSAISYSYQLSPALRVLRRGQPRHVVRCEHFTPEMLPVAQHEALCGVIPARYAEPGNPGPARASCPACRREFRKILAAAQALIQDKTLVTCPDGCTRPDGRPVLCDPVYSPDAGAPYATGRFRCPLCRREHEPAEANPEQER